MRVAAWCVGAGWVALITGCGGASPSAKSASSADPEAELAAAEGRIVARFGALAPPADAQPGQALTEAPHPTADAARPEPPAPSAPPEPSTESETGGGDAASDEDVCEDACDALSTMERASERICALDPGGARCDRARQRTAAARARVASSCPACSA